MCHISHSYAFAVLLANDSRTQFFSFVELLAKFDKRVNRTCSDVFQAQDGPWNSLEQWSCNWFFILILNSLMAIEMEKAFLHLQSKQSMKIEYVGARSFIQQSQQKLDASSNMMIVQHKLSAAWCFLRCNQGELNRNAIMRWCKRYRIKSYK